MTCLIFVAELLDQMDEFVALVVHLSVHSVFALQDLLVDELDFFSLVSQMLDSVQQISFLNGFAYHIGHF